MYIRPCQACQCLLCKDGGNCDGFSQWYDQCKYRVNAVVHRRDVDRQLKNKLPKFNQLLKCPGLNFTALVVIFCEEVMGKCKNHPRSETAYFCFKHKYYLCEHCLKCSDPAVYCKFRSSCMISFMQKEQKIREIV